MELPEAVVEISANRAAHWWVRARGKALAMTQLRSEPDDSMGRHSCRDRLRQGPKSSDQLANSLRNHLSSMRFS